MGMQYFGSEFGWPQYLIDKFANPYIPKIWLGTLLLQLWFVFLQFTGYGYH